MSPDIVGKTLNWRFPYLHVHLLAFEFRDNARNGHICILNIGRPISKLTSYRHNLHMDFLVQGFNYGGYTEYWGI